ncbi:MAG TPA: FtsX-like permease family protein [Candidatus Xenobia bacterium]|nr:FtsX-like permease family protein [Candidatus Xenobia bacterium]
MKFLPLLWGSLKRKRIRTGFTLLSILIAFVLYGYLSAINKAFELGVDVTGEDRLVLRHKVSFSIPLPVSYGPRIARIPGVVDYCHANWFGGIYQDPKNFFGQFPVTPEAYLRMYPEFLLPEAQKQAWFANRTGAVAGRKIADKYGWKIGDRIPIQATVWRKKDGSSTWEFELVGIYDGATPETDTTQFLFHYDYFDEARAFGNGTTDWYIIRIDDPPRAAEIAQRIDAEFANSSFETKTSTEKAFVQGFAEQIGNIGAILGGILAAVFFTILLVTGNTMMQSVRERVAELAVLKTVGFSNRAVLALVLAESLTLAGLGGGLGLLIGWLAILQGDPTQGFLPVFFFPPEDIAIGVGYVAALGLIAGLLPAVQAMNLRVVDALRRV